MRIRSSAAARYVRLSSGGPIARVWHGSSKSPKRGMRPGRAAAIHAERMYSFFNRSNVRPLASSVHSLRLDATLRTGSAGFTLVELLVVVAVIGVLVAIAVPSYLGLADRATNKTSEQQIRAAMPAAQAFFLDN